MNRWLEEMDAMASTEPPPGMAEAVAALYWRHSTDRAAFIAAARELAASFLPAERPDLRGEFVFMCAETFDGMKAGGR